MNQRRTRSSSCMMSSSANSSADSKATIAINALNELKQNKSRSIVSLGPNEVSSSNNMNELCTRLNDFTLTPSSLIVSAQSIDISAGSPVKQLSLSESFNSAQNEQSYLNDPTLTSAGSDTPPTPSTALTAEIKAFMRESMRQQRNHFEDQMKQQQLIQQKQLLQLKNQIQQNFQQQIIQLKAASEKPTTCIQEEDIDTPMSSKSN